MVVVVVVPVGVLRRLIPQVAQEPRGLFLGSTPIVLPRKVVRVVVAPSVGRGFLRPPPESMSVERRPNPNEPQLPTLALSPLYESTGTHYDTHLRGPLRPHYTGTRTCTDI